MWFVGDLRIVSSLYVDGMRATQNSIDPVAQFYHMGVLGGVQNYTHRKMLNYYVCAYHDKSVSITCTVATIHKSNWCAKTCDMWWHLMTKMLGIYVLVGGLEHFFIFHNILGIIIPTDFHIFQRGWNHHDVQSEVAWALLSSLPAWQGAIGAVTWEGIAFRVFQHTGWSANLGETREIPWFIMINHCTIWIATWGYINISHYYHTQPYLKPKSESSLADWPLVWPFAISCSIHTLIGWTLCSHDLTCEYAGYSSIGEDTLWLVVWNIFFPYIGNNHPNWLSYFSEG